MRGGRGVVGGARDPVLREGDVRDPAVLRLVVLGRSDRGVGVSGVLRSGGSRAPGGQRRTVTVTAPVEASVVALPG